MPVEERRRVALHRLIAAAWGEEAADTLFELVAPSGQDLATRQDLASLERRLDARFEAMDERADARVEKLEHRLTATFERRMADAVTAQTRTLVFSQLGALVAIAALAFGLR